MSKKGAARKMIRAVKLEFHVREIKIRAPYYVRDPRVISLKQGYVAIDTAAKKRQLAADIMMAELQRIEAAILRARRIAEALGLQDYVDDFLAKFAIFKEKASKRLSDHRSKTQ